MQSELRHCTSVESMAATVVDMASARAVVRLEGDVTVGEAMEIPPMVWRAVGAVELGAVLTAAAMEVGLAGARGVTTVSAAAARAEGAAVGSEAVSVGVGREATTAIEESTRVKRVLERQKATAGLD